MPDLVLVSGGMDWRVWEIYLNLQISCSNKVGLYVKSDSIGLEVTLSYDFDVFIIHLEVRCDGSIPEIKFLQWLGN